jgi:hypothetical protein
MVTTNQMFQPAAEDLDEDYEGWGIVEMMGHRKIAGKLSTQKVAGSKFLRIDIPARPDTAVETEFSATQFVHPNSLYALHPTTEEVARAVAARMSPDPVTAWDVKALMPAVKPVEPLRDNGRPLADARPLLEHKYDEETDDYKPGDYDEDDDGPF